MNDINVPILKDCARCGKTHKDLTFEELIFPIDFIEKKKRTVFTHFALCPNNKQPILLRQT
jgi:hypothetical protein